MRQVRRVLAVGAAAWKLGVQGSLYWTYHQSRAPVGGCGRAQGPGSHAMLPVLSVCISSAVVRSPVPATEA